MNFETLLLKALDAIMGDDLATLSHAIVGHTASDAQIAKFCDIIHEGFDTNGGCMVDVTIEMEELNVPHAVINRAIRTYVRKTDARESVAAQTPDRR